jgi:ferredoxin--NADP+ reductase
MIETFEDTRVMAPEHELYNASLVRRDDESDSLAYFWVRFDGDPTPFEPGQYMTIGVVVDGKMVQRPYSVASPPVSAGTEGYEFYVRLVQGGTFTPLLWRMPLGQRMRMIGPKGKFLLQPDDDRTHIFISSGTGNAPFVSMMKQMLADRTPRPAVLLNGVSYSHEIGYRDILEAWERTREYPVTYVPTVSRPDAPENAAWTGRTGRVEVILEPVLDELGLTPANSVAYICGNPDMIQTAEQKLLERGFAEHQVHKELYWPKGKEPRGVAAADLAAAIEAVEKNADQ